MGPPAAPAGQPRRAGSSATRVGLILFAAGLSGLLVCHTGVNTLLRPPRHLPGGVPTPAAAVDEPPLWSFGVVTDAQYADVPDGKGVLGMARHYRWSLSIVERAAAAWAARDTPLAFVMHSGDLLDGKARESAAGARAALAAVLAPLRAARAPLKMLLGNHDQYCFNRSDALRLYGIAPAAAAAGAGYYAFAPAAGWRVIVLDNYEVGVLGRPEDDPVYREAKALLLARNPNAAGGNWNSPAGLSGDAARFTALGGALGAAQLAWLERQLAAAAAAGDAVLLFSHVLLHPAAASRQCGALCTAWDYPDILATLRRFNGTVRAAFAGHDHFGGYARDGGGGAHFVTLQGVIETAEGDVSFGTVDVYRDRLELRGAGRMRSLTLPHAPAPAAPRLEQRRARRRRA